MIQKGKGCRYCENIPDDGDLSLYVKKKPFGTLVAKCSVCQAEIVIGSLKGKEKKGEK